MKLRTIAIVVLVAILTACNENKSVAPNPDCFEVSLVTSICSSAILKIEDPRFYSYGENWNGQANVFFAHLPCPDKNAVNFTSGEQKLFVMISEKPFSEHDCATCLAVVIYEGSKSYFVKFVPNCNSESDER